MLTSIGFAAITALTQLTTVASADGTDDPAALCAAALQRAAGNHAKCLLHAQANLTVSDDLAAHDAHIDRCEAAHERRHERALGRFGADNCPTDSADDIQDTIAGATAPVVLATLAGTGGPAVSQLGPMTEPVRGMNYQPAPTNYTCTPHGNKCTVIPSMYFDTDFYNEDFEQIWRDPTAGLGDVKDMHSLNVNFVRIFNWNPQRNHEPWLQLLDHYGIYTAGVFNNDSLSTASAEKIIAELNSLAGKTQKPRIAVWLVGNERTPDQYTNQTLQAIAAKATSPLDTIPICRPSKIEKKGDKAIENAITKVKRDHAIFDGIIVNNKSLASRYIACFNFYGIGKAATSAAEAAQQVQDFLDGFFSDSFVKSHQIRLLFTEFGINFDDSTGIEPNAGGQEDTQGEYLDAMLAKSIALQQSTYAGRFLGQVVFEYTNEDWKDSNSEKNFGLYRLDPQAQPWTGMTKRSPPDPPYPLDPRVPRANVHDAVAKNYH